MTNKTGKAKPKKSPVGAKRGRPTSDVSQEMDEVIKTSALDQFLAYGFHAATMNDIAAQAGTTKRTIYARYVDKEHLFNEVFEWAMISWRESSRDVEVDDNTSVEAELLHLANVFLKSDLNSKMVQLGRIAASVASGTPNLQRDDDTMSWLPRIQLVSKVLQKHIKRGSINTDNVELAADLFVSMVTGMPTKLAAYGIFRDREYEKERIVFAINMFLDGVRQN